MPATVVMRLAGPTDARVWRLTRKEADSVTTCAGEVVTRFAGGPLGKAAAGSGTFVTIPGLPGSPTPSSGDGVVRPIAPEEYWVLTVWEVNLAELERKA